MNILELTYRELTECFSKRYNKREYHAKAIYREIMQHGNTNFEIADEFIKSPALAEKIKNDLNLNLPSVSRKQIKEGVTKFVTKFSDGFEVESVIIPMLNYKTICISSQVGCKMGCLFCETGQLGFKRNLSVSEIVSQVWIARFILKENIKNIVFMGMGEPLDNFDNVLKAIEVLNDQRGLDFAHSHITVSTAGLTKGIEKLGKLRLRRLNLAISLNAPNDEIRSYLMPINKSVSMSDLRNSLLEYPLRKNGSFLIEYVLLKGVNDSKEHAYALSEYLKPLKVRFNLIPYNACEGSLFKSPTDDEVHRFAGFLEDNGIFVRKRWSKGCGVMAGCGQLGKNSNNSALKSKDRRNRRNGDGESFSL